MAKTLTYGRLYDKLAGFGYNQRTAKIDGKTIRVFEHKSIDNALLTLPERDPNDPVEPLQMRLVLSYLQSRGVVPEPESNPLLD